MVPGNLRIKNDRYYMVLDLYEDGKRKQKWITTGLPTKGNKKKAEAMLLEKRQEYEKLQEKPKENELLFSDFLTNWLKVVRPSIEETTYGGYYFNIKRINEYFVEKKIPLRELTKKDIKEFYSYVMAEWGNSANTVKHYHANIRKALQQAVDDELIPANPAIGVALPKVHKFTGKFYNADEVTKLFQVTKGTRIELAVMLGAFYGLRRGEIVGLMWDAIDFKNKKISVRRTVTQSTIDGEQKIVAKERAKNESSIRSLPLVDEFYDLLTKTKDYQDECKRVCGRSYNYDYDGFILVDELGERIKPDYITQNFPILLKNAKMRPIRFHDLRHTSASLLLANGIDLKSIQEWLGHSNFSTTANLYAHLDASSKEKSADAMKRSGIKFNQDSCEKQCFPTNPVFSTVAGLDERTSSTDERKMPPH